MTDIFTTTPEGFLKGRACVTSIGVFPYQKADGTIEWELRHPDDVFADVSMDSLRLKPLTNDHPAVFVDATNVKEYQVGNLGDNPFNGDNIHLTIDMVVQDNDAIANVLSGKRELSCGYSCDLVDEAGAWLGVPYDKRQKNIRYNHVAIVDNARAGEAARIRFDSADAIMVEPPLVKEDEKNIDTKEANMPTLKKIVLDGIDYEAEEAVIKALNAEKSRADAAEKVIASSKADMQSVEAARDTFKDRVDALEKELAEVKASHLDIAAINAGVEKKIALIKAAEKAEIELKGDEADVDIQKAVIMKVFPNAKLDGHDGVYLTGRFDGALEFLDSKADATVRAAGTSTVKVDEALTAKSARGNMIERLKNQHKAEK
jgi:hypothetical protein